MEATGSVAQDLGYGVTVRADGGGLVVESLHLDLGWEAARGRVPGSAILWDGHCWEVVERSPVAAGLTWQLAPWPDGVAMRGVSPLDAVAVATHAAVRAAGVASRRVRRVLIAVAPFVALAPGSWQERWRREHGFPAIGATYVSALLETGIGMAGVMQLLVLAGGGGMFLPRGLHWLAVAGPLLAAEGLTRLVLAMSRHEPAGGLLGLPLLLLETTTREPERPPVPECVRLGDGVLELASPILRRDWQEGGVLAYRERLFRLERCVTLGRGWRYAFFEVDGVPEGAHRLRLLPPPAAPEAARARAGGDVGPIRFMGEAMVMSFAPGELQRRWAARHELSPLLLTALSAVTELIGGLVNLGDDAVAGSGWLVLDAVLVGEGAVRLLGLLLRRPLGSLLGLPLLPLARRIVGRPSSSDRDPSARSW